MIQGFADMIIDRKGRIVNVGSIGGDGEFTLELYKLPP